MELIFSVSRVDSLSTRSAKLDTTSGSSGARTTGLTTGQMAASLVVALLPGHDSSSPPHGPVHAAAVAIPEINIQRRIEVCMVGLPWGFKWVMNKQRKGQVGVGRMVPLRPSPRRSCW
jgi:hypothetical protein